MGQLHKTHLDVSLAQLDRVSSWLGTLPGTTGTTISQVIIANLLGHDAVAHECICSPVDTPAQVWSALACGTCPLLGGLSEG